MMINIPFYPNTPDNLHCYQSCLKMVLKYFLPNKEYSYDELDKETDFGGELGTWPFKGMLWLKSLGFDVKDIEMFDYKKFVKEGYKYFLDFYGEEFGKESIKNMDLEKETKNIKRMIEKGIDTKEKPTLSMIESLLKENYLIISLIYVEDGSVGHFIVITGVENNSVVFNDPGFPPLENKKMEFEEFKKYWDIPDIKGRNLIAIKLGCYKGTMSIY